MLEMIKNFVTLTVSMVVASMTVFGITMKLMCSKKFMKKFVKSYMSTITSSLEENDEDELYQK